MFGHLVVDYLKGEKIKDKVSSLSVLVVESLKNVEMDEKAKILVNKDLIILKATCEVAPHDLFETPRKNGEKVRTLVKVDTIG